MLTTMSTASLDRRFANVGVRLGHFDRQLCEASSGDGGHKVIIRLQAGTRPSPDVRYTKLIAPNRTFEESNYSKHVPPTAAGDSVNARHSEKLCWTVIQHKLYVDRSRRDQVHACCDPISGIKTSSPQLIVQWSKACA
jgi:hypothetical protein